MKYEFVCHCNIASWVLNPWVDGTDISCGVAIIEKECKGMRINCCSNTDFIEPCKCGGWGQWAGSCCCCAGALGSRPTPNGQTSCRSPVCSSAGLQEAGRAWELPPPCPGGRVPALSALLWKGVIDGVELTLCVSNNWLRRDRQRKNRELGTPPSYSPLFFRGKCGISRSYNSVIFLNMAFIWHI